MGSNGNIGANGHRAIFGQLLRYGFSGALASVVNVGVYHLLASQYGFDPNLAWAIGFVAAMIFGYIIHSQFSFRGHGERDNLARTGGRFVIVSLVSFGLNSFWVWLTVRMLELPLWAPYPLALCITPLIIFTLNRRWVFR